MSYEPASEIHQDSVPTEQARTIWAALTDRSGLPVSCQGCVILLGLATSRPPSLVSEMLVQDVDLQKCVWHSPGKRGGYPVHLTRLALALIGHAASLGRGAGGSLLFPGRVGPRNPLSPVSLSNAYQGVSKVSAQFRRTSDIPDIAAWIMAEAGVESRLIRAALGKLNRQDIDHISKFFRLQPWLLDASRNALERLETSLMRITALKYSDALFHGVDRRREPIDPNGLVSPDDVQGGPPHE